MAYIICEDSNDLMKVYKIAADDNAKNNLNFIDSAIIKTISDDDFNCLRNGTKEITGYDGNNHIFSNIDSGLIVSEEFLRNEHLLILNSLKNYLDNFTNHYSYNDVTNYVNLIKTFDYGSITYPLNKTWGQYCEENNINYFTALQLP